jgi:hypothetical protein
MFDFTITLGTVIEIASIAAGGMFALSRVTTQFALLNNSHSGALKRLDVLDAKLEGLTKVTVELARQEERMNAQDGRIQELSNRVVETLKALPPPSGSSSSGYRARKR